jgi:excisionase family DNA binding protein
MKNFIIKENGSNVAPIFLKPKQSITMLKYLTVKMLSEYLHISTSNIYKRITDNSIPHIKMEKRVLFDREQIDQWMSSGCQSQSEFPTLKSA